MTLYRHNTIGSSAYKDNAVRNIPSGRVPSVLFRSLNKSGRAENFRGDPMEAFKAFYRNAKFPAVFTIGLWRDIHDFKGSDDKFVISKAKSLNALFTGKPIYYMPFLEDTLPASHKLETFAKIRQAAPNLTLVNNPANYGGKAGEYVQGMLNELHYSARPKGRKPGQELMIYCFDGVSCFDADFQNWRNASDGCHMFSIWFPGDNVKYSASDPTPRPQRKSPPLAKHYQQAEYMLDNPKQKTFFSDPGKPESKKKLYKSNADRHAPGSDNRRADTPVFILPQHGKEVVVKDKNGNKVFSAKYEQKYQDGKRHIYRPSTYKWPHEWAKIAVAKSGSSVCGVFLDGKELGTIDLAFRDGYPYKAM